MLKRLEALGFVSRTRDGADERRVLVDVTDRGTALRDEVASVPGRLLQQVELDLDGVRALRDQLVKLTDDLESRAS